MSPGNVRTEFPSSSKEVKTFQPFRRAMDIGATSAAVQQRRGLALGKRGRLTRLRHAAGRRSCFVRIFRKRTSVSDGCLPGKASGRRRWAVSRLPCNSGRDSLRC